MSLFGTSPDTSGLGPSQNRPSLFADEPPAASSSLFADDDGFGSKALWSSPGGKGPARQDLVKNLLSDGEVPESYIDAYDLILNSGNTVGSGLSLTAIREVLAGSGLNATDQNRIVNLVASTDGSEDVDSGFSRPEFNVLLALVGLAQEGEDITLDSVDERRRSKLSFLFLLLPSFLTY